MIYMLTFDCQDTKYTVVLSKIMGLSQGRLNNSHITYIHTEGHDDDDYFASDEGYDVVMKRIVDALAENDKERASWQK